MKKAESFESAIARLENDPDSERLKKLLVCACQHRWENDPEKLHAIDWLTLLGQVRSTIPTLRQLRESLVRVVARINKKSLYFTLAVRLVTALESLYPIPPTTPSLDADVMERSPETDRWFDLRSQLSQVASLSQAKILIYSAIHGKFSYTITDWNQLNHQEFDTLARSLYEICPTPAILALRLFGAAHCLDRPQEYEPIARSLNDVMSAFYGREGVRFPMPDLPLLANDEEDIDMTLAFPIEGETEIRRTTRLDVSQALHRPLNPSIQARIEVEKAAQDAANRYLKTSTATVEQWAKELKAEIEKSLGDTEPDIARSIEARILREFFSHLKRSCEREIDRANALEGGDEEMMR
ncbi:hypothetical protein [Baaleninema sp.]|uniref:hypothetical protein n=1 Tax=Baaleninema sp. TaxID=3101197 RepID=UPI003D07C0A6